MCGGSSEPFNAYQRPCSPHRLKLISLSGDSDLKTIKRTRLIYHVPSPPAIRQTIVICFNLSPIASVYTRG